MAYQAPPNTVIGNAQQRHGARQQRMNPQPVQGPANQPMQQGMSPNQLPNLIAALGGAFGGQQMQGQQAGQIMGGPGGQWGYNPTPQSQYVQATGIQGDTARDVAGIQAQSQSERNPWDALRQMMSSYPGVYGSAVQGTTAQNITQMNNEAQMNRLAQIMPFLQAMGGGFSTDYGAGYA